MPNNFVTEMPGKYRQPSRLPMRGKAPSAPKRPRK